MRPPTPAAPALFRTLPIGGYSDDERARMRTIVSDFLEYRRTVMERDIQRYLFFLLHGRYPRAHDQLPAL